MNKFLERHKISKLTQDKIDILEFCIYYRHFICSLKSSLHTHHKKKPDTDDFTDNFYERYTINFIQIPLESKDGRNSSQFKL